MARYVFIESRDPFESRDVPYYYGLATDLAAKGNQVSLFLVQNGVLATRKDVPDSPLKSALDGKVDVLADSFSLRERGISDNDRNPGVKTADIDDLVDMALADAGTKVVWH